MKHALVLCCSLLCAGPVFGQAEKSNPKGISDAAAAVKRAETILIPVYGKKQIESERPFVAALEDNVWTVHGTLHCSRGTDKDCVGRAAVVRLSRNDGRVLSMHHTK